MAEDAKLNPDEPARNVLPGSLKREFPGEHLDKSLNEIKRLLKSSEKSKKAALKKAKKILEQAKRLAEKSKG